MADKKTEKSKKKTEFQDREMPCKSGQNCLEGGKFTWTAGEQEFYKQKEFKDEPRWCKSCRARNQARRDGGKTSTRQERK